MPYNVDGALSKKEAMGVFFGLILKMMIDAKGLGKGLKLSLYFYNSSKDGLLTAILAAIIYRIV